MVKKTTSPKYQIVRAVQSCTIYLNFTSPVTGLVGLVFTCLDQKVPLSDYQMGASVIPCWSNHDNMLEVGLNTVLQMGSLK